MSNVTNCVKMALLKSNHKLKDLAERWEITQSAMSSKTNRDFWSADELVDIARFVDADLVFRFRDGSEVKIETDAQPRMSVRKTPKRTPKEA